MPLRLIKRGDRWHVHGTHYGVRIRQAAGTADRDRAEEVREKLERDIHAQLIHGKEPDRPFAEAAEGYLDAGGEDRFLLAVIDAFQNAPVAGIRQPDLDRAAKAAYPNAADSTRNRQFYTPFIAVMNYAADQGWCQMRKWRRPETPPGRLDWRTPEEMEDFVLAAPWHLSRNVIIYLATMMRASEGTGLDKADTADDGHEVSLWRTKGGYPRKVEVLTRARPLIAEVLDGPIIRTDDGRAYGGYSAINYAIRRVCDAKGLERFSLHTLRHTGATWRYAIDPDMPRLQYAGGWKSADLAMRYTHVSTRGLAERLEHYGWGL